ncbi:hypothetical protein CDAR_571451 [Caerostris darwini]|uniref:Uncharacterized protein n=1 Tax=Caerostris darwini TaxID=1538125 RepID=A0AAV4QUH9_9ARAC|nr:hypothetical protein CDAR_571451 [Caerostris darwini]
MLALNDRGGCAESEASAVRCRRGFLPRSRSDLINLEARFLLAVQCWLLTTGEVAPKVKPRLSAVAEAAYHGAARPVSAGLTVLQTSGKLHGGRKRHSLLPECFTHWLSIEGFTRKDIGVNTKKEAFQ